MTTRSGAIWMRLRRKLEREEGARSKGVGFALWESCPGYAI